MPEAVDAFDLPEWLGVRPVTWRGESSLEGHLVRGSFHAEGASCPCDVLAGDLAYPRPVLGDRWRSEAHQHWARDEVLLLDHDGRLTAATPGTTVDAELVLEVVRRVAKAVGAAPEGFTVTLRL